jgi:hypothetical protein
MKTILPLLFMLTSCGASVKEKIRFVGCDHFKSALVYNKTQNKYIADSVTINEPSKMDLICKELNNLKEVHNASINANFGFYELIATLDDGSKYNVNIIYTVYDGVIIRDEGGKYYKNDNLESGILGFFQK